MEIDIALSGFTVLRLLGAGGMGRVFLAEDTHLHRKVALKAVRRNANRTERVRLLREARVAAGLNHPGICTIHQVVEADDQVYIVMELVEGQTLTQRLAGGELPADLQLRYASDIIDALAYAHQHGVVHRDLKPSNIMLGAGGHLKILDFGLARQQHALKPGEATRESAGPITAAGEIVGTPHYMAPELLRGQPATPASDVWAVGVTLYEMAARHLPFEAPTGPALSDAILNDWPEALPSEVPQGYASVIHRCLQKDPAHRFTSGADLQQALVRLARPTASSAGAADRAPASRVVPRGPAFDSLAVLPLRNLSDDPGQEFFSDGLTETLINDLSKIRALKVISRTSVMRHRQSERPLPEIARELNVKAIVEGSVLRIGDMVRINVNLVDVSTDSSVWAESYIKPMHDVFALQSEVAAAIAREVQVTVTPGERQQLNPPARVAPEVYEAYLKGRHFWNMRTAEGFGKAVEWFQKAMALDASYALPYAVMADTLLLLGCYGFRRPREVFPPALQMVRRALDLDPSLAEAHSTLGWGLQLFDLDRPGAEAAFQQALELNPGHVPSHLRYGAYLVGVRRTDEGLAMLARGVELDPLSMIMRALRAYGHYLARDYDRATEMARATLELDPNFWWTYWSLAEAHRATGAFKMAIAELERAQELSPANAFIEGPLGAAYAAAGRRDDAQAVLMKMTERAAKQYVAPYFIGLIHLALGDRDRAFDYFSAAVAERDSWISFCAVNPALDEVRGDPRLDEIARQMQVDW